MTLVQIFWTFKETVVCPRFILPLKEKVYPGTL